MVGKTLPTNISMSDQDHKFLAADLAFESDQILDLVWTPGGCSARKCIPLVGWYCETPTCSGTNCAKPYLPQIAWKPYPLWHRNWPKWYPRCPSIHIRVWQSSIGLISAEIGALCRIPGQANGSAPPPGVWTSSVTSFFTIPKCIHFLRHMTEIIGEIISCYFHWQGLCTVIK